MKSEKKRWLATRLSSSAPTRQPGPYRVQRRPVTSWAPARSGRVLRMLGQGHGVSFPTPATAQGPPGLARYRHHGMIGS